METQKEPVVGQNASENGGESNEEKYNSALTSLKSHIESYGKHMAAEGGSSRYRAVNEIGCISDCLIQAVEAAKLMKIPQPEKQVLYNFRNYIEELGLTPENNDFVKQDIRIIFEQAGLGEAPEFEKTDDDIIESCHELQSVVFDMMGLEEMPADLDNLLHANLRLLVYVGEVFRKKKESSTLVIDPQKLIGLSSSLKELLDSEKFWNEYEELLAKKEKQGRAQTVRKPEDLKKMMKGSVELFSDFSMRNFAVKGVSRN